MCMLVPCMGVLCVCVVSVAQLCIHSIVNAIVDICVLSVE